jgi:hypothetical protein
MTAPAVLAEIDGLLNEHTDAEVATILNGRGLNGRGLASGRRMKFTGQSIGALPKARMSNAGMGTCGSAVCWTCSRWLPRWEHHASHLLMVPARLRPHFDNDSEPTST